MKKKEKIFVAISILFILGCICFYGARLIHYYKKFNPSKKESNGLLSVEIPKNSTLVTEGSGLYSLNGYYIYRGDVKDNYIMYSGLLFRILKVNYGSNIEIILDDKINILSYNNEANYEKSDINNYLNDYFISKINKDGLEKMEICVDIKNDLQENTNKCKKSIKVYSTIIDSNTYLSTISGSTYLNSDESLIYLRDKVNGELGNVIANGNQISYVNGDESYDIKPIISLKYDTKIISGTGTKDDPYIVDENKTNLGKTFQLDGQDWMVIDDDGQFSTLVLNNTLGTLKPYGNSFDLSDSNSIAYYLNNEYLDNLSFKNDIVETTFEIGTYTNNYKDIEKETVSAKVGMLSIKDFKFTNLDSQYLLINPASDKEVYAVDKNMYKIGKNYSKDIRPVIRLNNEKIKEAN